MKKQLYNRQCKTKHNLSHHLTIKALKHFGHQEHLCEFYSTGQAWRHTVFNVEKFLIYDLLFPKPKPAHCAKNSKHQKSTKTPG